MANTRTAILRAVAAADRLHRNFGTQDLAARGEGRIDVFHILLAHEIVLVFRPLKNLLGAFLREPDPGVIVTTRRALSIQRFTAAHELGHAVLKHDTTFDDDRMLARIPFEQKGANDLQEIEADAFASALLMPQWLVASHMRIQGWKPTDLSMAGIVYQLSLRLGTSYSGTCYALRQHRAITHQICQDLLKVPPKRIKEGLARSDLRSTGHSNVWMITERDKDQLIEGSKDDLLVFRLSESSGSGYVWTFNELVSAGMAIVADQRSSLDDDGCFGGSVVREVTAHPADKVRGSPRIQEVRPWNPSGTPCSAVTLRLDLSGPVEGGLLEAERAQILGIA